VRREPRHAVDSGGDRAGRASEASEHLPRRLQGKTREGGGRRDPERPGPKEGSVRGVRPDPAVREARPELGDPFGIVQRVPEMESPGRGSGPDGDAPAGAGKNRAAALAPLATHLQGDAEKAGEPIRIGTEEREVVQGGRPEWGRSGGGRHGS